eukprot:16439322-Heterocapsa_arctica.AAC.1
MSSPQSSKCCSGGSRAKRTLTYSSPATTAASFFCLIMAFCRLRASVGNADAEAMTSAETSSAT